MRSVPLLLALLACGAPHDDEAPPAGPTATCATSGQRVGVVTRFGVVRPDELGHVDGFDLDDAVTSTGAPTGCGRPDDVAPDGTDGIDSAFTKLLPALALTEAVALEDVLLTAVNQGDLLVLFRLTGLDDPVADDCATLEILRATGRPVVGAPGTLVAGQTFERDPDRPSVVVGGFPVQDGVLVGGPFDLQLPVTILGTPIDLTLLDARIRLELGPDGTFHGLIAGGVDVQAVLGFVDGSGIAQEVFELLQSLLGGVADLAPDETGQCTRISLGVTVEGVDAFLFPERPEDSGAPAD